MEHEYNHFKGGNTDLKAQTWHVFIHQWLLADKQMIITLQYKESERLYRQDKFMGDEWISLERENRMDFEGKLRVA